LFTPTGLRAPIQGAEANTSNRCKNEQLGAECAVPLARNRDQGRGDQDSAKQAERLGCPVPQFLRRTLAGEPASLRRREYAATFEQPDEPQGINYQLVYVVPS
jgi:hypothetical protein